MHSLSKSEGVWCHSEVNDIAQEGSLLWAIQDSVHEASKYVCIGMLQHLTVLQCSNQTWK